MISYAKNISTCVSTNFNIFSEEAAKKMVSSGLEHLIVSLDSASEDTYSVYQKGGRFSHVVKNIETLIKVKNDLNSKTPYITWYFIVFRHNEHEIEKAKELSQELGVDEIDFRGGHVEDQDWLPKNPIYQRTGEKEEIGCNWLWRNFTVNCDGGISPCCWAYKQQDDFGDITKNSFYEIWNNESFQNARYLFTRKHYEKSIKRILCSDCIKLKNWLKQI